jgi:hypothetical protein
MARIHRAVSSRAEKKLSTEISPMKKRPLTTTHVIVALKTSLHSFREGNSATERQFLWPRTGLPDFAWYNGATFFSEYQVAECQIFHHHLSEFQMFE